MTLYLFIILLFYFLSCISHLLPWTTISIIRRESRDFARSVGRAPRMTNSSRWCKWELSSRVSTRKRDWEWIRFPANKMHFWTIIHHVITRIVSRFAPISRSANETLFVFVSLETLLAAFCLAIVGRLIRPFSDKRHSQISGGFIAPTIVKIVQAWLDETRRKIKYFSKRCFPVSLFYEQKIRIRLMCSQASPLYVFRIYFFPPLQRSLERENSDQLTYERMLI